MIELYLIVLAIFVFLITTMYLERSEYCTSGINKILGTSSFALLKYFVIGLFLILVTLLLYYSYNYIL